MHFGQRANAHLAPGGADNLFRISGGMQKIGGFIQAYFAPHRSAPQPLPERLWRGSGTENATTKTIHYFEDAPELSN